MKVTWDRNYYMNHMPGLPTFTDDQVKDVVTAAGCTSFYHDHISGDTVFEVERMPENKMLIGLKWIEFR